MVLIVWVLTWLVIFAGFAGAVWVLVHFIRKFW